MLARLRGDDPPAPAAPASDGYGPDAVDGQFAGYEVVDGDDGSEDAWGSPAGSEAPRRSPPLGSARGHPRQLPRQLPNAITIVRILCAPIFLWMFLADLKRRRPLRWWAAVLFIVAIATDGIDGYLARRYEIVTDLGKLLDPIADKALTGCAFVGLSILGELDWWVTILVLVREIGITVHRLVVASDHVVAAAWMGKLKTVAQAVALSLALLPLWTVVGTGSTWSTRSRCGSP